MKSLFKGVMVLHFIGASWIVASGVNIQDDFHNDKDVEAIMPNVIDVDKKRVTPIVSRDTTDANEVGGQEDTRRLGGGRRCGDSCSHDWQCGGSCCSCQHGCCKRPRDYSNNLSCGDYCDYDGQCGDRCPDCRDGRCTKSRYAYDDNYDNVGRCGDSCNYDWDCGYQCPDCRHGECKKSRYNYDDHHNDDDNRYWG